MIKFSVFLIYISFIIPNIVLSQNSEVEKLKSDIKYDLSIRLNTAFSLGIEAGANKLLKEKVKEKPKKKKGEEFLLKKQYQYILFSRLGIEGGAQTFTGINNNYGITFRSIRNDRIYRDFSLSPIGCFTSIYGETYSVNSSGEVKRSGLSGRLYYSPSFSYSFGRSSKSNAFDAWYIRYNFSFLIRYNTSFLPMFNMAFGFNLK